MFFILDTAERLGFTEIWSKIEPRSPQGKKVKKAVEPLRSGDEARMKQIFQDLQYWLKLVQEQNLSKSLSPLLSELKSINGALERLADGDTLDNGECFALKSNLAITRKIADVLRPVAKGLKGNHAHSILPINSLDRLWRLLNPEDYETDRFYLWDAYDSDLAFVRDKKDQLQQEIRQLKREILSELEAKAGRGVPASGEVMVSKADEDLLKFVQLRADMKLERENFSAYFYKWIPGPQVAELEERLKGVEVEEERVTERVFKWLSKEIARDLDELRENQERLGELDWMLAKVEFALKHHCVPATLSRANQISIRGGRHLLVEAEVLKRGGSYTPIDIVAQHGVTIIMGSNMGGKTLNLRMVGLLTAMAQHGLCVPAEEMSFSLRQFIYFSVDDDQTKGDLSTFGQEIVGLNQALAYREERGLYLIDELARGTNPEEGQALGAAIIKFLRQSPSITILTTHFAALSRMRGVKHYRVRGLDQERYEGLKGWLMEEISLQMINQLMDYRLEEVSHAEGVPRDAIKVASLLGLNDKIILDAEEELKGKKTKGVSNSGK